MKAMPWLFNTQQVFCGKLSYYNSICLFLAFGQSSTKGRESDVTDSEFCVLLSENDFVLNGMCLHFNRHVNVNSHTCFCLLCSVQWPHLL